ncbi:TaqI-like C-terminal specificity domain-containing protein [Hydrogenophaga sp.]|uniref:TaqI-like C-terminal specificity domain-containing protein n=1 Tax=Hydrogenophaga sp. TaxID=1904254 RepID=UPI003F6ED7CB
MSYNAQVLRTSLTHLGYRAADVFQGFRFAAVDLPARPVREVDAAAFWDGPASYRTAALGVVRTAVNETAREAAEATRSLGAPFLVVIEGDEASMWTYTPSGATQLGSTPASEWQTLLTDRAKFGPGSIRHLKALQVRDDAQNTGLLFDPRTLYAIQANTQLALDDMLTQFLSHFNGEKVATGQLSLQAHYEVLFPLVFRLLAGKILIDREDTRVASVDADDPRQVVATVESLYSLPAQRLQWTKTRVTQLAAAWLALREGLYVRNVAADDLAFVYESTLITPETRKAFGTHSTPYSAADYVIRSLRLPEGNAAAQLRVYEPFAGACVFLTAALRRFKELFPQSWSVAKVHEHLVSHFVASEIDPFACEIARLALILADYPNHNGWRITREDLFQPGRLAERVSQCDVLLCNPPFEDFDEPLSGLSVHKPVVLLDAIVKTPPSFLGVVMPSGFSSHKVYREHIRRICEIYGDVEVMQLPEGVFRHASIGAEILIAQCRRDEDARDETTLRKSVVRRADWPRFTQTLQTSSSDMVQVDPRESPGLVALRPLRRVWDYLAGSPVLGSVVEMHRGLEWATDQSEASRRKAAPGFQRGLHRSGESLAQFEVKQAVYLDARASNLRGGAINYPWESPKLIANAIRTSRGPWRLAATVDTDGLLVSQQFYGIWLRESQEPSLSLLELCAILNSPVANAFSFAHDEQKHLRKETLQKLPLPSARISREVESLIGEYLSACEGDDGPLFSSRPKSAQDLLMEIDALVLRAYDLPPRLERELLRFMGDGQRPSRMTFGGYPGTASDDAAISLHKRLAMSNAEIRAAWRTLMEPLPKSVADVFDLV